MYIYAPISRLGAALLRVTVGVIFVWAGVGKMFNEGAPGAWSAQSFLKFATNGTLGWPFVTGTPDPKAIYNPTHDFWVSLAGNDTAMTIVNNLVVSGEVLIGIALILGIATRFAGVMGALMMAFFFLARLGPSATASSKSTRPTRSSSSPSPAWAPATTTASTGCSAPVSRSGSGITSCPGIRTRRRASSPRPRSPRNEEWGAAGPERG